jgi:hypothetical protein
METFKAILMGLASFIGGVILICCGMAFIGFVGWVLDNWAKSKKHLV